ncbi:MAG: hypothetical protein KGH53_02145 [Candidatus Micrarchaeota archaeon]|nr:hypothetical protein [Candidatus Micrarchaeota archaeon]
MALGAIRREGDKLQLKQVMHELKFDRRQRNWVYALSSERFENARMLEMLEISRGIYREVKGESEESRVKVVNELIEDYNSRYFLNGASDGKEQSSIAVKINSDLAEAYLTPEERFTVIKMLTDIVMNDIQTIEGFKIERKGSTRDDPGFIMKREIRK